MAKRIVIDTTVARELCYSEPPWFSGFVEMVADGWSFHLTDICIAEVIAARERGSISDEQWAQGVARLEKILGGYFPCLPGKRELFHLCGFTDEEDPNLEHRNEDYLLKYSRAIWNVLKQPMLPEGSGAEITFTVGGQKLKCPIKLGQAAIVLEEERTKWVHEMTRDPRRGFDYANAVKTTKAEFDTWAKTSGLPMSIRGDILAHAQGEWEARIANGYIPSDTKPDKKNDGIDFLLHFAFLWPALLTTNDHSLRNFLRGLGSFQAGWTHLPGDLADGWKAATLKEPDWPV